MQVRHVQVIAAVVRTLVELVPAVLDLSHYLAANAWFAHQLLKTARSLNRVGAALSRFHSGWHLIGTKTAHEVVQVLVFRLPTEQTVFLALDCLPLLVHHIVKKNLAASCKQRAHLGSEVAVALLGLLQRSLGV